MYIPRPAKLPFQQHVVLANRKWVTMLPKVYEALSMTVLEKQQRLGFTVLMKGFQGTDPHKCILCGSRRCFAGTQAGKHATELLPDRLHRLAKKRWLKMLMLGQCV
jgi:hypothetical protein